MMTRGGSSVPPAIPVRAALGNRRLRWEIGLVLAAGTAATVVWAIAGGDPAWPRWVWFGLITALAADIGLRLAWRTPPGRRRWFAVHVAVFSVLAPLEIVVWLLTGGGFFWPVWPLLILTAALSAHAWILSRLPPSREQELARRVETLTRTRRGAVDHQAAALRRIERDLHDGAQARLVSLRVTLGLAEQLVRTDPDAALALLAESRGTAGSALADLRAVMQQIHPPVLADRGLAGAIDALALDLPMPVTVHTELPAQLPDAVEVAAYFAVAECLTNVVKHSDADTAAVTVTLVDGVLTARVTDDGRGGASVAKGSGLRGVAERVEVFDGRVVVDSPPGGPTAVTITIRCDEEG
jgi:signal transduction histidine kinase